MVIGTLPCWARQGRPSQPMLNYLLNGLPEESRMALAPHLVRVHLTAGMEVHPANSVAQQVYFPTSAVVALRYESEHGQALDVALIDNHGMVGTSALIGADVASASVLLSGSAWRLDAGHLQAAFDRNAAIRQRLLGWIQVVLMQLVWSAACQRYHQPHQRLCLRLAQLAYQCPGQDIALTQKQLGDLVGVRRERANEVLGELLRAGLIEQRRGHITLIDPVGIVRHACSCHAQWLQARQRLENGRG